LIELIITMAMLGLLTALLFSAFELGTRVFRDTSVRATSENQLRSIKLLFERDVHHSNIWYCNKNPLPRPVGASDRDALGMPTLDNWNDDTNFDPVSLRPMWNRYIVWYATTASPTGALYRQIIEPAVPAGGFTSPYGALSANLSATPSLNADVLYTRIMSEDVIDFKTNFKFQDGTVSATVRLMSTGAQRPGTLVKTEENLQVQFTFQPKNSWPRI
jgi:hypothetical protein